MSDGSRLQALRLSNEEKVKFKTQFISHNHVTAV